jgi:hypothetical protein
MAIAPAVTLDMRARAIAAWRMDFQAHDLETFGLTTFK